MPTETRREVVLSLIPADKRAFVSKTLDDLVDDFRPKVERIEGNEYPTTKDSYGVYMGLLGMAQDSMSRSMIFVALGEAGANDAGLDAAYRICTGG